MQMCSMCVQCAQFTIPCTYNTIIHLYIAVCQCMHVHITCKGTHHALHNYTHCTYMTSCDTHLVLSGHIVSQLAEHSSPHSSESIHLATAKMRMVTSSTNSSPADSFSPLHCDFAPLTYSSHCVVH